MDLVSEKIPTEKKLYNSQDVCKLFSISEATVKNWIKLKKLVPNTFNDSSPLFSNEYIDNLMRDIKSNSSAPLKSRRNKKFASGSFLYKDYVSKDSINLSNIQELLDFVVENDISLSLENIISLFEFFSIHLIIYLELVF